jgi:cyclopropane fatty-acyl-phospholipid synthase-like methyltransferase
MVRSMRDETLPLDHFEALYARSSDPWKFATSSYERAKYEATLAALPRERYREALEVGCSIGVFTERLADRCDKLLAIEPVASALAAARRRNAHHGHVRFSPAFIPSDWPDGCFDLVILSEVLDYLGTTDLHILAERLRGALQPHADVLLVHWVGKKRSETAQPGEASEILLTVTREFLHPLAQSRNADYRLDILRRFA